MIYKEIQEMPTVYEKVHESIYRSYHVLKKVKDMLDRNDSKETILEVISILEHNPPKQETKEQ